MHISLDGIYQVCSQSLTATKDKISGLAERVISSSSSMGRSLLDRVSWIQQGLSSKIRYVSAFVRQIIAGKSIVYAGAYAEQIVAGKSDRFAGAYAYAKARDKSDEWAGAYATSYTEQRSAGKTHEYAHTYAYSIAEGKSDEYSRAYVEKRLADKTDKDACE